jgi:hypothetical protein
MILSSRRGLSPHPQELFFLYPPLLINFIKQSYISFLQGWGLPPTLAPRAGGVTPLPSAYALPWLPAFALWRYGVASWRDRSPCASAFAPTSCLWHFEGLRRDRLTVGHCCALTRAYCGHNSRGTHLVRYRSKQYKNSMNSGRRMGDRG